LNHKKLSFSFGTDWILDLEHTNVTVGIGSNFKNSKFKNKIQNSKFKIQKFKNKIQNSKSNIQKFEKKIAKKMTYDSCTI
jgi:division protein CdvB (Snf7/Vps24/ESCRT-III family)